MVENLCLILSLGAIFIQIWTLISAMESYLEGNFSHLGPTLALSGIAFACCILTAWTTTFDFSRKLRKGGEIKNADRGNI